MKTKLTTPPSNSNAASAQRQRILNYLNENRCMTTFEARDRLDIPSPAPRVFELRHEQDFNIVTNWRTDHTSRGKPHRVAEYVLLSGSYKEAHPHAEL